jgi:hypothetical protein
MKSKLFIPQIERCEFTGNGSKNGALIFPQSSPDDKILPTHEIDVIAPMW